MQEDEYDSASKSSSTSVSLSLSLQRQLLSEIELAGGIHNASLKAICQAKPDTYGVKNSSQVRSVQNKVYKWKQLDTEGYRHLLATFELEPCGGSYEPSRPK
jgi:hypothetical protein